jgi:hypothetical protein
LLSRAEPVERPIPPAAPQHPPNDLRIQRAAPTRHPRDRIDERVDVSHAFLQQVSDALRALTDEIEGVLLLVELRQHQDAGIGTLSPELERRPQPIVLVTGGHLDIDHRHIGPMGKRPAQKGLCIAGLRSHLKPGLDKKANYPLAKKHVVLADHHAQGL